ncbi:MAG: hypothetical protein ACRDQ5_26000 [Sciscionella sp.]
MSETQWRTAIQENAETSRIRNVPPVELPAPVERLGIATATRMGWHGSVLAPMTLLGRKVVAVAHLRADAHAERICLSIPPVTDRLTVATWTWPELAASAPPPAVELVGVLGIARHWRTGLGSTVPFASYCDTGIVLPWSAAMTQDYLSQCLPRAARYGVSVLTADPDGEVHLDQPGRQEPLLVEETPVIRWINELVYEQLLATVDAR